MQDKNTLLKLGFKHYQKWDDTSTNSRHYRLVENGNIFRATVWGKSKGYNKEHTFITLGIVINKEGIVDRWRDCISNGSVERKVKAHGHAPQRAHNN